ncbi:hypothetical protein [Amycolatopsis rubida]|uniref:Uncharacterized protein n=1 Tax=Amycolatopsis rubida TaxID=112413 RepID=A0A1I5VA99_9PSEU|nr:hypothetical protein [Amycolatopsis rubida]SFQ04331.1 hypothetical protein SAMN05421854_108273 [Amycolatopsis rubida]
MTTFTYTILEIIPQALLLIVGLFGLILSIGRRSRGGSGLMVAAFAVMLVTTALSIAWQLMLSNVPSWMASDHLSADEVQTIVLVVSISLSLLEILSWLLVVLAVVKGNRAPQPGFAPGGHPMGGQPGYPQTGYGQAGYPQAGYAQPGYPAQPQPGQPQPGYPQADPGQQSGYAQPLPPQSNPGEGPQRPPN